MTDLKWCWLCDEPVHLDPDGTCSQCDTLWRDPADGPSEAQIEDLMQWQAPRRFGMADKDASEDYR
jgi:hypothetical protein